MRFSTPTVSLLALALLCACDPTQSDSLRGSASVFIISPPGDVASGSFGTVLRTYEATVDGNRVSRIAVSGGAAAGAGSAFFVFFGFDTVDGRRVATFPNGARFSGCDMVGQCPDGAGVAIAGIPTWRSASGADLHSCILAPATSTGSTQIRCEDRITVFETVLGPGGIEFGAAAVGVPEEAFAVAAGFISAPGGDGERGQIFRVPNGSAPVVLDTSAMSVPDDAAMGRELELAPLAGGRSLLLAAWAPTVPNPIVTDPVQRVLVFEVGLDMSDALVVTPRACLEGQQGFGGALALGDLDGDGVPDLAVGHADLPNSPQEVHIFSGATLTAGMAPCGAAQPAEADAIPCTDIEDASVACRSDTMAPIGFGASLAIGDLDADMANDLVIGAPAAAARGAGSGAIFVVGNTPGGGFFPDRRSVDRHAALSHSATAAGDRLGQRVATFRGIDRDEIVASSPGSGDVAIFLCSGILGDRPSDFPGGVRGCLPPGS